MKCMTQVLASCGSVDPNAWSKAVEQILPSLNLYEPLGDCFLGPCLFLGFWKCPWVLEDIFSLLKVLVDPI